MQNFIDPFDPNTGYLGFLLRQSAHTYRLKMERYLSDFSITPPQFTILKILSIYNGISNAEVARLASLTPQTVNVMVSKLISVGYIVKSPIPENKKNQSLEITATGLILLEKCIQSIDRLEKKLSDGFEEEEIQVIRRWLAQIHQTPE